MSQTLRLFVNEKRISTAVVTKTGDLLQVHPSKKFFASEKYWRMSWEHLTHPKVSVTSERSKEVPEKSSELSSKNWTYKEKFSYLAPPGDYYIGDLCYVLSDEIYDKVFGATAYEGGFYQQNDTKNFFLVDTTADGDGCFVSSDYREFCVDAGIIGITPVSCMAKNDGGGHIYTFKDPVECRFKNGRFSFRWGYNEIIIDTAGKDDDY
jgi:hypothetical protein